MPDLLPRSALDLFALRAETRPEGKVALGTRDSLRDRSHRSHHSRDPEAERRGGKELRIIVGVGVGVGARERWA
jgi:hypothetical protein